VCSTFADEVTYKKKELKSGERMETVLEEKSEKKSTDATPQEFV
jgi:hypothetical protein